MSSRVLGTLSTLFTLRVMEIVLSKVVPLLNNVDNIGAREGAIEAIYCILHCCARMLATNYVYSVYWTDSFQFR